MQKTVGFAIGAPCLVALTLKLPHTLGDALRQRAISLETVAQRLDKTIAVELCLHLIQLKCRRAREQGYVAFDSQFLDETSNLNLKVDGRARKAQPARF